ncbi:YceG family protein [Helicovermis profundi]|uniref:YceG family protein n=1 Tax=Helicovermis profundi TaxID=3065157 RepID=A0AAU9E2Q8_9FIRM|nr:YceG family protein [Clostridia bacterium S502]
MINTTKYIKINTIQNKSFFSESLLPILSREGSSNSKTITLSTFFTRRIGCTLNENQILNNYLISLEKKNILFNVIDKKLNFDATYPFIGDIKNSFNDLNENLSNLNEIIIKTTTKLIDKNIFKDSLINSTITEALNQSIVLFKSSENNCNKSKILNLYIKLFYWINVKFHTIINFNTNFKNINFINSKLIYIGEISKHETFLIFALSRIGVDILYINSVNDNLIEKNSYLRNFTNLITLTKCSENFKYNLKISKQSPITKKQNPINNYNQSNSNTQRTKNRIHSTTNINSRSASSTINTIKPKEFSSNITIKKKEFKGDLKDIYTKLNERIGYIGLPNAVIPTFFIRYIGVSNNLDQFKNSLYNLNKKLENYNYIKIEDSIKIGNPTELLTKTKQIWSRTDYKKEDIHLLICKLNAVDTLSYIPGKDHKNQIYKALEITLIMLFENTESIQSSKIKNIIIKQLAWLKDVYNKLFVNFDYKSTSISKILYYGDIKMHEGLFLTFMYYIGVDIIYINTMKDEIFENLDPNLNFSSLYVNETLSDYFAFPKEEVLVRRETTAYKASEEIGKIIHNEEDGVYKPWQFESYNIKPITLMTTFDEFGILWKEESRFRDSFKVQNNTVYIPNLFTKISGTNENESDYYKYISSLTSVPLVKLYNELPIINNVMNKQEIYRLTNVFSKDNLINSEELKKHPLYKYSYLSENTQNKIIIKTNELLDSSVLTEKVDINLRLKVLSTVLSLDKDILELIQNFDYPMRVPKVIVYDSKETTFSREDSIVISFLYLNGFDICILTPTGYNNFEMFIDSKFYDIFKLETKKFNLTLPDLNKYSSKKSKKFWSSLFG